MTRSLRSALALAALALPGSAHAAGFAQPVPVPGATGLGAPQAAIAPDGRLVVAGVRERKVGKRPVSEFRAVFRDGSGAFSAPVSLGGSPDYDSPWFGLALRARPDGGFVACFLADRSRKRTSIGCRFAQPGGTFGPVKRIVTTSYAGGANFDLVVRADSTALVLAETYTHKTTTRTAIGLSTTGTIQSRTRLRAAATEAPDAPRYLHAPGDGSVAMTALLPTGGKRSRQRRPAVRIAPPGSTSFGPPVAVSTEPVDGWFSLGGGSRLVAEYDTRLPAPDDTEPRQRLATRVPDGTWGLPLAVPIAYDDEGDVLIPQEGEPLALVGKIARDPEATSCAVASGSQLSVRTLAPLGQPFAAPTQVLREGQVARRPHAAALADGTLLASWENAINEDGDVQVEAAIREPGVGSFTVQTLPVPADAESPELLASGDRAALVWREKVVRVTKPTRVFVSALQAAPPYAAPAALPAKPVAPCDD